MNVIFKALKKIKYRYINKYSDFKFDRLEPIQFKISDNCCKRINILVPTLSKNKIYGGIKTALDVFYCMVRKFNCEGRIIITSDSMNDSLKKDYEDYIFISNNDDKSYQNITVCSILRDNVLLVRENDYFIATFWTTIYKLYNLKTCFRDSKTRILYLIQDYEAGFYPWSSDYILCDSTYKNNNVIAIFNSKYLYDYFMLLNYKFVKSYYFDPVLHEKMRKYLLDNNYSFKKENILVFYGRPSKPRNCFSLIVKALSLLHFERVQSWKFFSIGEKHKDIRLKNGVIIESLGKLSIDSYCSLLSKSKIGISLMVSPHPSYPPLEMAAFGLKTITNSYLCKDLSTIKNVFQIDSIDFYNLSSLISELLLSSDNYQIDINSDYIAGKNQLEIIMDDLIKIL